jgi:hypothetical protein
MTIAPDSTAGTPPVADVLLGAAAQRMPHDPFFTDRAERLSASATRAARILSEVLNARYTITGTLDAPELRITCVVAQGEGTGRIVETLTEDMVETLEGLLGTPFTARHITVDTVEV